MNVIKKSTWTIVILGAAAGCAGEGDTANPPAAGPGAPSTVSKPSDSAIPPAPPIPTRKVDDAPAVEGPKAESPKAGGPKAESPKSGAAAAKLTAEEIAGIKELPAADQAPATNQIVCPVSAHNLGSMGKPIKVTADGRTIYLCCESCEDKFKSDPKAFFAKLDKK